MQENLKGDFDVLIREIFPQKTYRVADYIKVFCNYSAIRVKSNGMLVTSDSFNESIKDSQLDT